MCSVISCLALVAVLGNASTTYGRSDDRSSSDGPYAAAVATVDTRPTTTSVVTTSNAEPSLLFDRYSSGGVKNTLVVGVDGGGERPLLTEPLAGVHVQHANWSPDGAWVAFETLDASGSAPSAAVWIVGVDGAAPQVVLQCEAPPCRQYGYPDWSPDGVQLVAIRYDSYPSDGSCCSSSVIVAELEHDEDGTWAVINERVVASFDEEDAIDRWDNFLTPRWSPDGKSIAYTVEQYGFEDPYPLLGTRVAVVSVEGDDASFITDLGLNAGDAEWHPCANLLVVATYPLSSFQTSTEPSNLYTIRSDGAHLAPLTDQSIDGSMRFGVGGWTSDGQSIALTVARASDGATLDSVSLATMDTASGELVELGIAGAGPKPRPVASPCSRAA